MLITVASGGPPWHTRPQELDSEGKAKAVSFTGEPGEIIEITEFHGGAIPNLTGPFRTSFTSEEGRNNTFGGNFFTNTPGSWGRFETQNGKGDVLLSESFNTHEVSQGGSRQ
jgi:hypothetical protein